MDRLSQLYENGRRFQVGEAVERGPAVALGLTISQPDWSGTVEVFKVFTFGAAGDNVVHMQDCDSHDARAGAINCGEMTRRRMAGSTYPTFEEGHYSRRASGYRAFRLTSGQWRRSMAFTSGRRNASHDTVHEPMIVSQGRPWSGWTTVWTMQVGLLGPLRVVGKDGVEIGVGAPKERAVLELLALRTGQVVPARSLIDALWGEDPPSSATKTLQTYISSLRRLMPVGAIETVGGGYRLVVPTDAVDALHFEELVRRGGRALQQADLKGAAEALAAALRLWRGEPLVDMGGQQTGIAEAARLSELRRDCEEQLAEARLALGEHHSLVADLETAVAADPLRERRWAQLMVALYRAGRQADALRAFQRLRRILADDLGLEPSAELRALEDAILRQAPELAWRRSVPVGELTNPVPAPTDARRSASADEPLTGRPESPTGALVTFLFTDIESSTSLWEQHPALMAAVLERHDRLAGDVMRTEGGHVFKVVGDAVHAVFTSPVAAIRAALAMQATVAGTDWGEIGCMRVRIGIYTGEARLVDGRVAGSAP